MTAPTSVDDGARRARTVFEIYRQTAPVTDASTEALLRSLILDLAHLAAAEGIPFMPAIAHAQAWWLTESAKAKKRPNVPKQADAVRTPPSVTEPSRPLPSQRRDSCPATASPAR